MRARRDSSTSNSIMLWKKVAEQLTAHPGTTSFELSRMFKCRRVMAEEMKTDFNKMQKRKEA